MSNFSVHRTLAQENCENVTRCESFSWNSADISRVYGLGVACVLMALAIYGCMKVLFKCLFEACLAHIENKRQQIRANLRGTNHGGLSQGPNQRGANHAHQEVANPTGVVVVENV
jgi:hypothetical protein